MRAAVLQVLFKMDKTGEGQMICLRDLSLSREPSFVGFTHDMFVEVQTPVWLFLHMGALDPIVHAAKIARHSQPYTSLA